jgi:hypothetical protein
MADVKISNLPAIVTPDAADVLPVVDTSGVVTNKITTFFFDTTAVVVNNAEADRDFRVAAVGATNALFVRGSDGNVGVGTPTPSSTLMVNKESGTTNVDVLRLQGGELGTSTQKNIRLIFQANGNPVNAGAQIHHGHTVDGNSTDSYLSFRTRIPGDGGITITEKLLLTGDGVVVNDTEQDYDFRVGANGITSALLVQGSDGSVGIGTGADQLGGSVKLHVSNGAASTHTFLSSHSNTPTVQPFLVLYRSRGTLASPAAVASGDLLGEIQFSAQDNTNPARAAKIVAVAEGAPTSLNVPSRMAFFTSDGTAGSAEGVERMRIDNAGNVGINNDTPVDRLDVVGGIRLGTNRTDDTNKTARVIMPEYDVDEEGFILVHGTTNATNNFADIGGGTTTHNVATRVRIFVAPAINTLGSGNERLRVTNGAFVVNPNQDDVDFIVGANGITNALFVQGSDGFVGFGTGAPAHHVDIVGGVLATGDRALNVAATTDPGAGSTGAHMVFTTSGTGSAAQNGLSVSQLAGVTAGLGPPRAFVATTNALDTHTAPLGNQSGATGVFGQANGVSSGSNIGVYGEGINGLINYAVAGRSTTPKASGANVAVMGFARNTGASGVEIGGMFSLQDASFNDPILTTSAALIADNQDRAVPIFLAWDNGSEVFRIDDGGKVGVGVVPVQHLHVHESTSGVAEIKITNSTTGATAGDGFAVGLTAAEEGYIWHYEAEDIRFGTSNLDRMRLTADGKLGLGVSPTHFMDLVAGTLATGVNAFKVAATLPVTGVTEVGAYFDITPTGAGAGARYGVLAALRTGYTGATATAAVNVDNQTAGTGTGALQGIGGNAGVRARATATTVGTNSGLMGSAMGGNVNIGAMARALTDKASANNLGMVGMARNDGASGKAVGGVFSLYDASYNEPVITETAALIADNQDVAAPIIVAYDNGSEVFRIPDGGGLRMKEIATPADPPATFGAVYFKSDGNLYQKYGSTESKLSNQAIEGTDYVPYIQTTAAETATFTAVLGETHVIDTSGGGFTANLPAIASGNGRISFYFDGVGAALTLDPNAAETVEGKTTFKIYRGHNTIENDGTGWKLIQRSGKSNSRLDPAQITANQDGYNPTDWGASVSHVFIDSDAERTISGFEENGFVDMDQVIVVNDGAQNIVIAHDAATTVANRVLVDGGSDIVLGPDQGGVLLRDGTVNKWRFYAFTDNRNPTAHKTADQNVASSVALVTDTHLTVGVRASTTYRVKGRIFVTMGAGGIQLGLGGTATATSIKGQVKIWDDAVLAAAGRVTALDGTVGDNTATGDHFVEIDAVVQVNAAGTLALRWTQNVSDAANTTVQLNSCLEVMQL